MIKDFIDIYSKLEIGIISFIAPTTSYLLTTYMSDRKKIIDKLNEQQKNIESILEEDFKIAKETQLKATEFIKQSELKQKSIEEEIKFKLVILNFLQPKKCIVKLFCYLTLSMILLLTDVLIRGDVFNFYNHILSVILFSLSIFFFIFGIILLFRIAVKLIDAKEILDEELIEISRESEFVNVQAAK